LGELVEDHRELQRRRVAALADRAVTREAEKRLEQHLRLESRARCEANFDRCVLRREDAVLRADRNGLDVAGAEAALLAGDDDPERALEHLVAFLLARMQMVPHRESARHELELVLEHLATGFRGRAEKDEPS